MIGSRVPRQGSDLDVVALSVYRSDHEFGRSSLGLHKPGVYTPIGYCGSVSRRGGRAMETLEYTVRGMSCRHCEASVTEEVGLVPGVTRVAVDLKRKRVEVHGTGLDDAAIRAAYRGRGLRGRLMAGPSSPEQVRLEIDGMTCASCATRIERRLNKLDGVAATVNYATEEAAVAFDPEAVTIDELIATVGATGYRAALPALVSGSAEGSRPLLVRLAVAAALTAPLVALSMRRRCSSAIGSGLPSRSRRRSCPGRGGRSTAPRRSTPGTCLQRWIPSSPSARWPPGPGQRLCCSPAWTRTRTSRSPP